MDVSPLPELARPSRWEQAGLVLLALLTVAFGALVEYRSTRLQMRKTDLPIYLRAASELRAGRSPYEFTSTGESHYNYPPLLALVLAPLAHGPEGDSPGTVPFAVSVALWYGLSVLAVVWAVHVLARRLERASTDLAVRDAPPGCWRWWALRVIPVVVCLPGIARTLALGQVDLLVLFLICAALAATLARQGYRAGLLLSGAVCIKLIPAFLLIYPVWRRDLRCLAGFTLGVALGCGLIPAAVLGPAKAWAYHRRWAEVVVLPALGLSADRTRESDLTSMASVHSQSLVAVFHAFQHPDRDLRPAQPGAAAKGAAVLIVALMVLVTLAAARYQAPAGPPLAIAFGGLVALMLLLAPVCHPHYFCHWLPLVTGLVAWDLEQQRGRKGLSRRLVCLLVLVTACNTLTSVPGLAILRDRGLATAAGIALWAAGVAVLRRGEKTEGRQAAGRTLRAAA